MALFGNKSDLINNINERKLEFFNDVQKIKE